ncbi:MAG: hypothetical protein A2Y10_05620 [Planctomycetes bacterium GWF2_41_51]|nr:MAG: hypothetical protein A2Y10_05620 [Planctomycetes bacterium GWF2_41_51]
MKRFIFTVLLLLSLSIQAFAIYKDNPNTFLTAGFEGQGENAKKIFWTALNPDLIYPEASTSDSTDKYLKYDPNIVTIVPGKWGNALDAGYCAAANYANEDANCFSLGVNLNADNFLIADSCDCMLQFWWKPNFPRPAADVNTTIRIWQWKNNVSAATFYLEYRYISNRSTVANAGKEYLNFRAATGVSTGDSTSCTPTLAPSIDFEGWNFVSIGWENISTGGDHTSIKVNNDARTTNPAAPLRCINFTKYWQFMNGYFDDIRIVREYIPHWEIEQDRLLGREFTPNPGPRTCADAFDMGFGSPRDVNKDCKVDFQDFAELAIGWMECVDPEVALCSEPWI